MAFGWSARPVAKLCRLSRQRMTLWHFQPGAFITSHPACYVRLWHFGRGGAGTGTDTALTDASPSIFACVCVSVCVLMSRVYLTSSHSCVCMYADQRCCVFVTPGGMISVSSCFILSPHVLILSVEFIIFIRTIQSKQASCRSTHDRNIVNKSALFARSPLALDACVEKISIPWMCSMSTDLAPPASLQKIE